MTHQQTALVIGGSGGIGRATVHRLLKSDMRVAATYHSDAKLAQLQQEFEDKNVTLFKLDLVEDTTFAFEGIRQTFPLIDIVVFAPTLPTPHAPLLEVSWECIEEHIAVQLRGMHSVLQSLKGQLQKKHSVKFIVLLTEYCLGKPPSGLAPYVSAKYALMGFAKIMAVELARYGSTVNMISPGMVKTPLLSSVPSKLIEMNEEQNPLKRIATPEDIANVVAFLASDQSDYLNGALITVNGGSAMI